MRPTEYVFIINDIVTANLIIIDDRSYFKFNPKFKKHKNYFFKILNIIDKRHKEIRKEIGRKKDIELFFDKK